MQSSSRFKRVIELSILGVSAGIAVACGDRAVDMAGEMVADAGDTLLDAGTSLQDSSVGEWLDDAGHMLQDAGHALQDAGGQMRDGSHELAMDARAQETCGTCSNSGAVHHRDAADDPAQWVLGALRTADWTISTATRVVSGNTYNAWIRALDVPGPLVITDIQRGVNAASQALFTAPAGTNCMEARELASYPYVDFAQPAGSVTISGYQSPDIHGAHLIVRADEHLCIINFGGIGTGPVADSQATPLFVSAYHPYD
jgi:hypothetical protein